jgi:DNA-binding transcriptional MerR regulator
MTPYKQPEINKIYYTIGEVAELLKVNPSLLRYWEKEFSAYIKPFRNKKGNRFYTTKDIELLKLIYQLVKIKGMTLEGAKKFLKQKQLDEIDKTAQIVSKLQNIKNQLLEIKAKLKELNNE